MKREVFKKAHKITKNIIRKGDNYRATFKLALSFVYSQIKKGVSKMIELKGSEKQIKWANDLRAELVRRIEEMKEIKLSEIVGDKVKKSGKVLTESERKNVHAKKFDNALEFILNQEDSEFFIKYFRGIHEWSNLDMWRYLQDDYFRNTKMESLDKIASYWQGR